MALRSSPPFVVPFVVPSGLNLEANFYPPSTAKWLLIFLFLQSGWSFFPLKYPNRSNSSPIWYNLLLVRAQTLNARKKSLFLFVSEAADEFSSGSRSYAPTSSLPLAGHSALQIFDTSPTAELCFVCANPAINRGYPPAESATRRDQSHSRPFCICWSIYRRRLKIRDTIVRWCQSYSRQNGIQSQFSFLDNLG